MGKNLNKYKGCLVGGAVGDALGYAVEFDGLNEIYARYGKGGIKEYELSDGKALVSDDTQMTLFTANGLLFCHTREVTSGIKCNYTAALWEAYKDWLSTQYGGKTYIARRSWLVSVPELNAQRAPGNTCISALEKDVGGTIEVPINDSKGCGGIMRVAPIGLFFIGKDYEPQKIDMLGAEAAALTHGHDLGYISAAALTDIIYNVASKDMGLKCAVKNSLTAVNQLFLGAPHLDEFTELINLAIELSASNLPDTEAIRQLGEGWVAEETLAIAVFCSLKYRDDFEKAIVAAVNHSGDSDSTGAVTGNILGAFLGLKKIPEKFITNLEMVQLIEEMAEDLYIGYDDSEKWKSKYVDCNFAYADKKRHRL